MSDKPKNITENAKSLFELRRGTPTKIDTKQPSPTTKRVGPPPAPRFVVSKRVTKLLNDLENIEAVSHGLHQRTGNHGFAQIERLARQALDEDTANA